MRVTVTCLFACVFRRYLNLHRNQLSGSLPASIGELRSLM
jgi:hypothetical protein